MRLRPYEISRTSHFSFQYFSFPPILPAMSEPEKQFSLPRAVSMNLRGAKSNFLSASGLILLLLQAVATQAATTVTKVAAGLEHSLFLQSDGSLWVMGLNIQGQLGDGTFNNTNRPEQIVSNNVISIDAASDHRLLLKSDCRLWGMRH